MQKNFTLEEVNLGDNLYGSSTTLLSKHILQSIYIGMLLLPDLSKSQGPSVYRIACINTRLYITIAGLASMHGMVATTWAGQSDNVLVGEYQHLEFSIRNLQPIKWKICCLLQEIWKNPAIPSENWWWWNMQAWSPSDPNARQKEWQLIIKFCIGGMQL